MSLRWRRGATAAPAPPPPVGVFGPTLGAPAVRAASGPRAVTNPGGGISFNSSGSLQSAINANATGALFVCSVNNPVWNSGVSTGTKAPTIIFPGAVGQCVINGNGADIIPMQAGDGTTVKGGTWQNFGTTTLGTAFVTQDAVTIEDVRVTGCFVDGIGIQGLNTRISHSRFDTCGRKGLGTGNTGNFQTDGLIVEFCDIYGNNTRGLHPGGDASGTKILFTAGGIFRNNWVHDNNGFGLWLDTACYDCLIEENVCENNGCSGLFYEANYGSTLRHNYVGNNGRPDLIGTFAPTSQYTTNVFFSDNPADQPSPGGTTNPVDFSLNYIDHTLPLIALASGGSTGNLILLIDFSDTTVRHAGNHDIHDNQFWLRFTTGGAIGNRDDDVVGTPATTNWQVWDRDNHYFANDYRVASLSVNYWVWATGTAKGANVNWATWQGFHPGDVSRQLI